MSSRKAIVAFADTVLQHFPPFRWDEEKEAAWAETMVKELSGFSAEVINRAAREMVRTRKKEKTPLVSECIDACSEAKRWLEIERSKEVLPVDASGPTFAPSLDWTADRLRLASELMDSPLGKQAAREGWVGILWSFARKNARMPEAGRNIEYRKSKATPVRMVSEIEFCKLEAADFGEAYKLAVRGAALGNSFMMALEKLGAEMLRRRHVTEQRVLGGRS